MPYNISSSTKTVMQFYSVAYFLAYQSFQSFMNPSFCGPYTVIIFALLGHGNEVTLNPSANQHFKQASVFRLQNPRPLNSCRFLARKWLFMPLRRKFYCIFQCNRPVTTLPRNKKKAKTHFSFQYSRAGFAYNDIPYWQGWFWPNPPRHHGQCGRKG